MEKKDTAKTFSNTTIDNISFIFQNIRKLYLKKGIRDRAHTYTKPLSTDESNAI